MAYLFGYTSSRGRIVPAPSAMKRRTRRRMSLGDSTDNTLIPPADVLNAPFSPADIVSLQQAALANQAAANPVATTPAQLPALVAPPSVITQAYNDVLTQQKNSTNPLDYTSPQAAVAAGIPQQVAYDAWGKQLAKFPTQQAALAAGVPSGVVTQLWQQSRQAAATQKPAGFLDQSSFGVKNKFLVAGGAALVALAGLKGRR